MKNKLQLFLLFSTFSIPFFFVHASPTSKPSNTKKSKSSKVKVTKAVTNKSSTKQKKTSSKKSLVKFNTKCPKNRRVNGRCIGRVIGVKITTKVLTCPVGGEKFKVYLYDNIRIHGRDSDLRPRTKRVGQKDRLWMCPNTFFAAFPADFKRRFDKKKMAKVLAPIQRMFRKRKVISGAMKFVAAAATYQAWPVNDAFFGKIFLRATWAAREEKNASLEKDMRFRTISAMKLALKRNQYRKKKVPSVTYLIAELYRQHKDFKKAQVWIQRAKTSLDKVRKGDKTRGTGLDWMIQKCEKLIKKKDPSIFKI